MNDTGIRFYHSLPYSVRSLMASLYGYHLRKWRYGRETEQLIEEAQEREQWSAARWKTWQEERAATLLHRAATQVPYYRDYWQRRRRQGDRATFEELKHWPVLHKETVRKTPRAFVADDCNIRSMYNDHTSGTTGTPLNLWHRRSTVRQWNALVERRMRQWCGISRFDRWGLLGGQPVAAPGRTSPPFWVWNAALNQLYLSAMHIAPWSAASYLEAIQQHKLQSLLGYSSSLYFLAQEALASNICVPLKVVLTNAEPLYEYQRQAISKAFACPVRETYGMAEMVCAASDCEQGHQHLWPEVGIVELLDDQGCLTPPGTPGRIIATGLLNRDMPLIRYDTRDLGQMCSETDLRCACSRQMPMLKRIWGRCDDTIVTRDGRKLVQIDRIFDPTFAIAEAQIIQDEIDRFRIRVVPRADWPEENSERLSHALKQLVGEATVEIELTSGIERTWAGKFRMIVSKVTPEVPGLAAEEAITP